MIINIHRSIQGQSGYSGIGESGYSGYSGVIFLSNNGWVYSTETTEETLIDDFNVLRDGLNNAELISTITVPGGPGGIPFP